MLAIQYVIYLEFLWSTALNSVSTANCECPCWPAYVLIACLAIIAIVIFAYLVVNIKAYWEQPRHRDENHHHNAGLELERRDDNLPDSK